MLDRTNSSYLMHSNIYQSYKYNKFRFIFLGSYTILSYNKTEAAFTCMFIGFAENYSRRDRYRIMVKRSTKSMQKFHPAMYGR